jgi:hypothetical protein
LGVKIVSTGTIGERNGEDTVMTLSRCKLLALAFGALVSAVPLAAAHAADKVNFVTDYGYNGRHAYYFVALEKGYYKDAGLDVSIMRGKGSVDAIHQVGAGNALLGFADAGSLILARANDKIPVKLVSIVYARPPQAIFCREDLGVKSVKDLEGKSVANPAGGSIPDLFPAFAKASGIDAAKVHWVVASSQSLPSLLANGRVPCIGQFTVGEALLKAHISQKLVRLAYSDPGLSYYGNGIIAREDIRFRASQGSRGDHAQIPSAGFCRNRRGRDQGSGRTCRGQGRASKSNRSQAHPGHARRHRRGLQTEVEGIAERCLCRRLCRQIVAFGISIRSTKE